MKYFNICYKKKIMIPKKIHFCWFWYNKKSDIIKKCIKSWKKSCPDFKIIEWNEENFNVNISNFTRQAYKQKKWAYVADYARFYILEKEWWIYLDTDMFLYKNLTPLLKNNFFLWIQHYIKWPPDIIRINWWIIWMTKNNKLWKKFIKYYNGINDNNIIIDRKYIITDIIRVVLEKIYNIKDINKKQILEEDVVIYPIDYFYAYDDIKKQEKLTNNTYSIHYWLWSWVTKTDKIKQKITLWIVHILEILKIKDIIFNILRKIKKNVK